MPISPAPPAAKILPRDVTQQVELQIKYSGYIQRQEIQVEQHKKLENKSIPESVNYGSIKSLSREAKEKLEQSGRRLLARPREFLGLPRPTSPSWLYRLSMQEERIII